MSTRGPPLTILDLPSVVRCQIYSYLVNPAFTYVSETPAPFYDFHPSILFTSRAIRRDVEEYFRMYCMLIHFEFSGLPYWLDENYFLAIPNLKGLPASAVEPILSVKVFGDLNPVPNNSLRFFTGREALQQAVKGAWEVIINSKSRKDLAGTSESIRTLEDYRAQKLVLSINQPDIALNTQAMLLYPFLRIHHAEPAKLLGKADPSFQEIFVKEFYGKTAHINDGHSIKKFFADGSSSARKLYNEQRYYQAFQEWDILDGYWVYLNRLSDEDPPYRSIVRYMASVFSSYRLEMYLGCALCAMHFQDYSRALEAAQRPYTRQPPMRLSETAKEMISVCDEVALNCMSSAPLRPVMWPQNCGNEAKAIVVDLLSVKNSQGVTLKDTPQFSLWTSELEGKGIRTAVDVLAYPLGR